MEAFLQTTEEGQIRMEESERRAVQKTAEMVSRRLVARGLEPEPTGPGQAGRKRPSEEKERPEEARKVRFSLPGEGEGGFPSRKRPLEGADTPESAIMPGRTAADRSGLGPRNQKCRRETVVTLPGG